MADVQKPVESKPVEAPAAEVPAAETATEAPAESSAAAETPAAEETKPAEEAKPKTDGHLEYKSPHFPSRLLFSKKHFWFGDEQAVDVSKKTNFPHELAAWASHTGKGIVFIGDKSSPSGAIHLKDASEPTAEGTHKFHFFRGTEKHTFKANSTEERDSWVAQFKAKIAEAKELAAHVTETETYKSTLASLKPAAPAKKEKEPKAAPAETPAESSTAAEVKPGAAAPEEPAAAPADAPKETKEEGKRSASRKRGSIFGAGGLLGKREKKAAEETPAEPAAAEPAEPAAETPAEVPAAAEPAAEAAAPAEAPAEPAAAAEEAKPEVVKEKESKPAASKRTSFFGNFSLGGKKKSDVEASSSAPVKETPAEPTEPIADLAPEIPPVETTTPLAVEVSSPANLPTETTTTETPAATNGDSSKKEAKNEKRKSSLPFAFGAKKDKSAVSDEEGAEKPKSPSVFSKIRGTIKGKGKAAEKPAASEKPAETEAPAASEPVAEASEPNKAAEPEAPAAEKPAEAAPVEEPTKPENPLEKPGAAVAAPA